MDDDKWLEDYVAYDLTERDQAEDDLWSRVSRGELSPEEAAAQAEPDEAEELRRKAELFAPPSAAEAEAERERLLDQFFPPENGEDKVVPFPRRRRRRLGGAAGGAMSLAAVAALVLYCNKPEAPPELIPQYSLEWDKEYKGTMLGPGDAKPPAGCEARYHIDGAITARLRPGKAMSDDVGVRMFVSAGGKEKWVQASSATITQDGIITIQEPIRQLGLAPGQWSIAFFITHRGQPIEDAELLKLPAGQHPGVTVARGSVCVDG